MGYCCSIYDRVDVDKSDIQRLAKHFGVGAKQAKADYTTVVDGFRTLKRKDDLIFDNTCIFLNQTTRLCSIYEARPETCREWPKYSEDRCVYYDILQFERKQQDDDSWVPVVEIRVLVDAEDEDDDE